MFKSCTDYFKRPDVRHMRIPLLLFFITTFVNATPQQLKQVSQEEAILTNIVFMRTEGLLMTQLIEQKSKNKKVLSAIKRAKRYYTETQPMLLEVIKGKALALDQKQFDYISQEAEKKFQNYDIKNEGHWIKLYQNHIQNCIRSYSLLLQDREWASVTYFSFYALPELINLDQEFIKLNIK